MEIGHSAEELGHIFSIATGPAFFLGAIAAFLSIMLGRLNSVLARFKESAPLITAEASLLTSKAR